MSHKQCYEKRELLNRENLAQAAEIGRLRQELASMKEELTQVYKGYKEEESRAEKAKRELAEAKAETVSAWDGMRQAKNARDSALASLAKAKEEVVEIEKHRRMYHDNAVEFSNQVAALQERVKETEKHMNRALEHSAKDCAENATLRAQVEAMDQLLRDHDLAFIPASPVEKKPECYYCSKTEDNHFFSNRQCYTDGEMTHNYTPPPASPSAAPKDMK